MSTSPWAVSPEQIRILDDSQLNQLMQELLLAEAYRCEVDVSKVLVNTEDKSTDDGCDGWTPAAPPDTGPWLLQFDTCWQFKAGTASQPKKLGPELRKKIPLATLEAGGRFVVVANSAGGGKKEYQGRLDALKNAAKEKKLQNPKLEVLTSETLATWANQHPAIASVLRGMPRGCWSLTKWASDSLHREPWQSSRALDTVIATLRDSLSLTVEQTLHVHVFGPPGIGKTRAVLEACRGAPWSKSVMYIPQAADARAPELLDSVADAGSAELVLVVDEVQSSQVAAFNACIRSAGGRLRLITIGHEGSPDSTNIDELKIDELDAESMSKIVEGWYPNLPKEHVQFVVSFAGGYVKLARLAAFPVARDPSIDASQLMVRHDIRQLMDNLLGKVERRRALHVLAVLSSVGWTGKRAVEGEAIAKHFGLDWAEVQREADELHARYGIAPRGGDLRYISPRPLGVYLALEALSWSPEKVRTLPEVLPNDASRAAYYDRLRTLVVSSAARSFVDEELSRFSSWHDFADPMSVARWEAWSGADPETAARVARKALEEASHAERSQITRSTRRHLVRGLLGLAWHANAFEDAALALAELAEAENEGWVNNATGEFLSKYQLVLGGTACPYLARLGVIDELLKRPPAYQRLAVSALASIGGSSEFRVGGAPSEGKPSQPEWQAETADVCIECAHAALTRLTAAVATTSAELGDALGKAACSLAILLRQEPVRDAVAEFIRAAVQRQPEHRESVRREVYRILNGERKHWKTLNEDDLAWLAAFHAELEDHSPSGQLRQVIGNPVWGIDGDSNLTQLAIGLYEDRSLLDAEWSWLTSGEAVAVWALGQAIARADVDGSLLSEFMARTPRGPDNRLIAGYLQERAKQTPDGWLDDQIDEAERRNPENVHLLFELTWRCAPTTRGAERLVRFAEAGRLSPAMIAHLVFGGWSLGPSVESFRRLLQILVGESEVRGSILQLLEQRLSKHPNDLPALEDLAVTLVSTEELLRNGKSSTYAWGSVAKKLVSSHAREVARTIFACQAFRGERQWSLENSEAHDVIEACAEADPEGVWAELVPHLESTEAYLFGPNAERMVAFTASSI